MLPQQFRWLRHSLGWCAKTVDSVADRLIFRGFKNDNFDMQQIFNMNNPDIFFDSAIISALISSCCFIYISPGEDGFPRLQVIDGYNATGIIDPITGLLTEGYAVISRDEYENPDIEAYFTADSTIYSYKGQFDVVVENKAPYPLLVPIIYKPDAKRPFGRSRITRAEMSIMQSALRTLRRAEVSGEFYSYPQRYLLGLSDDVEIDDKWQAAMTAMLTITRDADGNCTVVYNPGEGKKYQNVWSKEWKNADENDKINNRKKLEAVQTKPRKQKLEQLLNRETGFVNQLVKHPKMLQAYTPVGLKQAFINAGYDVRPLGRGRLKGVPFEEGGGYRVLYGGDGYFQYHPKEVSHHKEAYYKTSNGRDGIKRYNLNGDEKND